VRPSYFALEADIELTALIKEFDPCIEDPQIDGMRDGPFTTEGFLRGWSYGNAFAISTVIRNGAADQLQTVPQARRERAWEWNYRRRERMIRLGDIQFFPEIALWRIAGETAFVAVWATGMPIMLPEVDYVLVGRDAGGEQRYGLAAWSEVLDVVGGVGIDTQNGR
jgi:hypothetical protein